MTDQKILLVDDSKIMRKMLKKSFLRLDIAESNILEASDGSEALEQLMLDNDEKISIVITDIIMPNLDGYGLVKAIRTHPEFASAHIIVLSSIASEENRDNFKGNKIDAFLKKPFNQESFEKIVVPIIHQSAALQSVQEHFDEQINRVDTCKNRVIFGEDFLHECLKDVDKDSDIIDILHDVLTKKLHLAPKDIINITDTQIIIDKYVDAERERKKRIKKIRIVILKNREEADFVNEIVQNLLDTTMDLRTVDQNNFVRYHEKLLKDAIANFLFQEYNLNIKDATLYTEMIIVKYKRSIYNLLAKKIMFFLGKNNQVILSLIGRYSGGIKEIEGVKYKIPFLKDKDGKRLQIKDITLIANRLVQVEMAVKKSKENIEELKTTLTPMNEKLDKQTKELSPLIAKASIDDTKEIEKIELEIKDTKNEISALTDKIKAQERIIAPYITQYNELLPRYATIQEYIKNVLLAKFEVTDPGKWYHKEIEEDKKEPITEEKIQQLTGANREMTIKLLFSDKDIFEYKILNGAVLDIEEPVFFSLITNILENTKARNTLSFKNMTNFDKFSLKNFIDPITTELLGKFKKFLFEIYKHDNNIAKEIYNKKFNQQLIRKIAIKLLHKYKRHIASVIADTFLDATLLLKQEDVEYIKKPIPKLLDSSIAGNEKHQSILLGPDNTTIANNLYPVWVRTQQAKKARDLSIKKAKDDYLMYKSKQDGYDTSIEALHKVAEFTLDDIEEWGYEKLRDITVNDEDECKEEKRLIQYMPSGVLTDELRARAEKGKLAATSEIAKEEYLRAFKFMELLHANNTEATLKYKLEELEDNREKSIKLTIKSKQDYEKETQKKLFQYDETLNIIYKSMIYNFLLTLKSETLEE